MNFEIGDDIFYLEYDVDFNMYSVYKGRILSIYSFGEDLNTREEIIYNFMHPSYHIFLNKYGFDTTYDCEEDEHTPLIIANEEKIFHSQREALQSIIDKLLVSLALNSGTV